MSNGDPGNDSQFGCEVLLNDIHDVAGKNNNKMLIQNKFILSTSNIAYYLRKHPSFSLPC